MIYSPSEDSYLLKSELTKIAKGKSILDIGTGSGILALSAKEAGASSILASDIDSESIKHVKSQGIKAIQSNLFSKIKGKFDIIVFNPPYLPLDKREPEESRKATTGGKHGDEIILKFLKQSKSHLNKSGTILLLLSSLTPTNKILFLLNKLSLNHKVLSSKSLFFETLFVWEIYP